MAKPTSKKILARIGRAIMERRANLGPTGGQARGPVWRGPLPRRLAISHGYTPEHAEHNRKIDERNLGFGVTPMSGLATTLARLNRRDRRALLAIVQRKAGTRRAREERALLRRLASEGITL